MDKIVIFFRALFIVSAFVAVLYFLIKSLIFPSKKLEKLMEGEE
jgi:hypothetical protein